MATIRQTIADQITATGRHTPQEADAYARLTAEVYAVQARRLGITPGELFGDALAGADAVAGVAEKAVADSRLAMVAERFPDLQVQLDGMDAPMPMADFMAAAKAEAADMAADAPLMKTAVECFLLNGAG